MRADISVRSARFAAICCLGFQALVFQVYRVARRLAWEYDGHSIGASPWRRQPSAHARARTKIRTLALCNCGACEEDGNECTMSRLSVRVRGRSSRADFGAEIRALVRKSHAPPSTAQSPRGRPPAGSAAPSPQGGGRAGVAVAARAHDGSDAASGSPPAGDGGGNRGLGGTMDREPRRPKNPTSHHHPPITDTHALHVIT